jgi:hypothetical protein
MPAPVSTNLDPSRELISTSLNGTQTGKTDGKIYFVWKEGEQIFSSWLVGVVTVGL